MEGDLDPFDFQLALDLGMTVGEMHARMSNVEYWQWRGRSVYLTEMAKLEAQGG